MKIENITVYGFQSALRGMRNPMDSWNRSDSAWNGDNWKPDIGSGWNIRTPERPLIGPKDLELACKLVKNGCEHRKFLRQIQIWIDIDIPRYVWQELDTYKVATVRNSCSTMNKLGKRMLVRDDFQDRVVIPSTLYELNVAGLAYREKREFNTESGELLQGYDIVRYMKKIVPEGFLQRATYTFNYETALTMYFQRRNHRLPEWNAKSPGSICSMLACLPYMKEFIDAASKE